MEALLQCDRFQLLECGIATGLNSKLIMSQIYKFIIKVPEHGQRLDKFLTQKIEGASRSLIKKWIDKGAVKINEGVSKCGHILHKGDSVVLDQPPTEPLDVLPEDIPLKILYEDGEIIVVDKPVGMVV